MLSSERSFQPLISLPHVCKRSPSEKGSEIVMTSEIGVILHSKQLQFYEGNFAEGCFNAFDLSCAILCRALQLVVVFFSWLSSSISH